MVELDAPLGAPGSLVLHELMDIAWRHAPEPRRAATLLQADLPTGRLVLACNQAVDAVTASLDGRPVGRVHDTALRPQGLMFDGAPGPAVEVGERSGRVTWRMRGSKLRPLGRQRWLEVQLGDGAYSYWMKGLAMHLAPGSAPDGDSVVRIGNGGRDPDLTDKVKVADLPPLDAREHLLRWEAGTTTGELVLAELMTMGMATLSLWSLPGKLLSSA